jgi:hypothetical protein
MCFFTNPNLLEFMKGDVVDVAFSASVEEFRGEKNVLLNVIA